MASHKKVQCGNCSLQAFAAQVPKQVCLYLEDLPTLLGKLLLQKAIFLSCRCAMVQTLTRSAPLLLEQIGAVIEALFSEHEPVCLSVSSPAIGRATPTTTTHGARVTLTRNVNKEQHFVNGISQ